MDEQFRFKLYLFSFLGLPYIWGGASPLTGLDCSGLAQLVLARLGLDPPGDQSADGLHRHFRAIERGTPTATGKLGTLAFYGQREHVTHVAVCLDELRMVEAGGGGSDITNRTLAEQHGAEVRIARINRRSDLVALITPTGLPW